MFLTNTYGVSDVMDSIGDKPSLDIIPHPMEEFRPGEIKESITGMVM